MDLERAEPDASVSVGRRNLIGMAGMAGLAGAAAALLADRPVLAAPSDDANRPTDADRALLEQALSLELTARDLYRAQLDSSPSADLVTLVEVIAANHGAYAESIAGFTGSSVKRLGRDEAVYEANLDAFSSRDFAESAHRLEQTAVATHTSLLAEYESNQAILLTASIITVEARHATVLADVLGVDDLDVVFGNDQSAIELGGSE